MLKGRSRDPRAANTTPAHLARPLPQQPSSAAKTLAAVPSSTRLTLRTPTAQRAPLAKPEPDYEVVEFPSEQYVNAKLQPPPPPPPRPPTGHPVDAGASCGLCGGGGARVRCAECGRRALCASCDDMYHRHPKRRHHQRQALTMSQLRDERPPLPPKAVAPVPPPRRHKLSGASPSPRPPADPRSATLGPHSLTQTQNMNTANHNMMAANNHMSTLPAQHAAMPPHLQGKILGSMPYLPNLHHAAPVPQQTNTLGPLASGWGRPRGSLPGFNVPPNMQMPAESWENADQMASHQSWGRPLRRGASVLELGAGGGGVGMMNAAPMGGMAGCTGCAIGWRYGSCASLDHPWAAWAPQPACCGHAPPQHHPHAHNHVPYTPQPYRRADSRTASRAASRACSRAASPAMSTRSRASRRVKHRTPSPPPLPSSDADSESESDGDTRPQIQERYLEKSQAEEPSEEDTLGPAPAPPTDSWQCEHCTFVNEPGVRVCIVCCRTPTSAPKIIAAKTENHRNTALKSSKNDAQSITDSAKSIADTARSIAQLDVNERTPSPPPHANGDSRVQNGTGQTKTALRKERVTTGCGPSPPRDERIKKTVIRLVTPTREASVTPSRHDTGVGSSPPKEVENRIKLSKQDVSVRTSPYREVARPVSVTRHNVSVGPSPPREEIRRSSSVQKKSTGTSSSEIHANSRASMSTRANVSNTGTSPPPQSISTQTYEVPNSWERAPSRSRARRRFRDDAHRERSHSRHSLSSDTRESERSARTSGGGGGGTSGRWEWREGQDSSPVGDWSDGERRRARPTRLARRASHLDLRRTRVPHPDRRASYYGSEAASPEPTRAMSMEALASVGVNVAAERGLELARLMAEAERLGFSAAEVQAALAQSPGAPLRWLRERWATLCAGVRAAAARLEPRALVTELEARAALARHRGAMWPAVTDCVERHRRQAAAPAMSGRVWGSPAGAEDDAAPPRRAEGSSDEFEGPAPAELRDDDWMYLPLDANPKERASDPFFDQWERPLDDRLYGGAREAALAVDLLVQAAAAPSHDDSLLQTLLPHDRQRTEARFSDFKLHAVDLYQSENDFIDAYNALTRSTPLPVHEQERATESGHKRDAYDVFDNDSNNINSIADIMADGPSNSFKNTINNHQSNAETQQQKRFEVNSLPNTNSTSTTLENEVRNGLADVSKNRYKEKSPSNNSQKVSSNHSISESTSSPTTNIILSNNVETIQNMTDLKLQNINTPELQKRSEMPFIEILDVAVFPVQTGTLNTDTKTVVRKYESPSMSLQNEEKSNNLNEIVDNTQRLIQQMKEEINSDINSIDSRNISQSEADSSSNESDISTEHESSYSESDKDSENLSSNDESSITDSNEKQISERRPTIIQRTSSEENDNFEEAMDHIEDQIEDFKHSNIELLDSIARSLQEEHSVSVEVNQQKNVSDKNQDQNNNLYNEVNSFEEIYAELKTTNANEINLTNEINSKNDLTNTTDVTNDEYETQDVETPIKITNFNLPKFEIVMSILPSTNLTKLLFSNSNIPSTYNAVLDIIEETAVINDSVQNNILDREIISPKTKPELETEIYNNNDANYTDNHLEKALESDVQNDAQNRRSSESESNDETHKGPHEFENAEAAIRDITPVNENFTEVEATATEESIPLSKDTEEISVIEEVINEEQSSDHIDVDDEKIDDTLIETQSNNNNSSGQISEPTVSKSSSNNSIASKTINSIKSNIPKLIKIVQSKQQKSDKTSPKVIASKVPVRRPSQKQYPAPVPPKSHFGNIQSGHVKQLQTRLFNNKLPKSQVNIPSTVDVKPSTSTLHKKKPAPPPPTADKKQQSPVNTSPPKQKKDNFFRESCRTEDEWTESDSEESQTQVVKDEEPVRMPSPPPPLTLRRVSGQIIDLAKVQLPEGSPERQARMVLAQGAAETWEQARLAVELTSRGASAPAALLAALDCVDLAAALAYLHQDCELCASRLPEHEMVSMLRCTHRCCRECARHYFTVQITERSIADCVCPYCKVPDLENMPEDSWLEYFAHLDILLKTLLETEVHELFQRKLRDRTLARDPNFRWCMECSSGFFVHPKQKRVRCPECRSVSCAKCRKAWSTNHEGLSCEQYATWLEDNDPERSVAAVQQHLRENGLECPRCHYKYSLSRGGCMHFTCTQCKYEFCYGCGKPFTMGARCGLSEYCAKLGLHAHHPRNCLFYLRDKEPHQLQTLLQMNNVAYETEVPEGSSNRCPIQLQRETPTGLVDGTCGAEVPPKHAGLCKPHYVEYLAAQARHLDPIPVMDLSELVAELRRRALPLPERGPWDSDPIYAGMCAEIVKEKIPLD